MPDTQPKVYVNGFFLKNQTISGQNGDYDILKLRVDTKKLLPFLDQYKNEGGFVNIDIRARKDVGQFGDTHYAVLNTFVPKNTDGGGDSAPAPAQKSAGKPAPKPKPAAAAPVAAGDDTDDIPF